MKVWEETPDGRKGWAPIFAENGREVITTDWATKPISLTQQENIEFIKQVIKEAVDKNHKIVFLGWSMGGPQAFILAADIMPERTVAILGYGATGPLNCYNSKTLPAGQVDLTSLQNIPPEKIDQIVDSQLFPKEYKAKYIAEYLVPVPPLMAAIQAKHPAVKEQWSILTVQNPQAIPPVLLINGTRDPTRTPEKQREFLRWLKQHQPDVTLTYVKDFPHAGMLCYDNEKIAKLFLDWLAERDI